MIASAISSITSSPYIVGLLAGAGAYLLVDYTRFAIIYKDDKVTLNNDMISPLTIGAAVAITMGLFWNSRQSSGMSSLLGASDYAPLQ